MSKKRSKNKKPKKYKVLNQANPNNTSRKEERMRHVISDFRFVKPQTFSNDNPLSIENIMGFGRTKFPNIKSDEELIKKTISIIQNNNKETVEEFNKFLEKIREQEKGDNDFFGLTQQLLDYMKKDGVVRNKYIVATKKVQTIMDKKSVGLQHKKFLKIWKKYILILRENKKQAIESKNICAYMVGIFEQFAIQKIGASILQKVHWNMMNKGWYSESYFNKLFDNFEKDFDYALKIELQEIEMMENLTNIQLGKLLLDGHYKNNIKDLTKEESYFEKRSIDYEHIIQAMEAIVFQTFNQKKPKEADYLKMMKKEKREILFQEADKNGKVFIFCLNFLDLMYSVNIFSKIGYAIVHIPDDWEDCENKNEIAFYKEYLKLWNTIQIAFQIFINSDYFNDTFIYVMAALYEKYGIRPVAAGILQKYIWNKRYPDFFDKETKKDIEDNFIRDLLDAIEIEIYENEWIKELTKKQLEDLLFTGSYEK